MWRNFPTLLILALLLSIVGVTAWADDKPKDKKGVTYQDDVVPILKSNCYRCHGPEKQESELRLDTPEGIKKGGSVGPAIVAGKADESHLIKSVEGKSDDVVAMPPEDGPLSKEQIATLRKWIDAGAKFE